MAHCNEYNKVYFLINSFRRFIILGKMSSFNVSAKRAAKRPRKLIDFNQPLKDSTSPRDLIECFSGDRLKRPPTRPQCFVKGEALNKPELFVTFTLLNLLSPALRALMLLAIWFEPLIIPDQ